MGDSPQPSLERDLTSLDRAIAFRVQRLGRQLRASLLKLVQEQEPELTPEQFQILFRLHEQDGQPQTQLADQVLQDHPNITRQVDAMQSRGLVQRGRDPSDGRRWLISLTRAGRETFKRLKPLIVQERQRLYADIPPRDLEKLLQLLDQLENNLRSTQPR